MNHHRIMFGKRLAELRERRGITQRMLADRINIKRAVISHYELGRREPDFATLVRIADFFKVSTDYLLGVSQRHEAG